MNMQPILQQLSVEDFKKMLAACSNARERFYLQLARLDPVFEYHIDLPQDNEQGAVDSDQHGLDNMPGWLADEKRFSNG